MTFTHVLCKIVVTQNINDKIGTLYILKMSYRGCCMKEASFSWSTKNSKNDFLQGIWAEIDKNQERGFKIMST